MDHSYKNKRRGVAFRKFNGNLDDNEDEEEARLDKEIPSLQNPFFRMPCAVDGCKYVEFFSNDGYSKHIISHYDEEKIKKNNTCKRCKVYISSRKHFDGHAKRCNILSPTRVVSDSDEPEKEDIPTASSLTFSPELLKKWNKFQDKDLSHIKTIIEKLKGAKQNVDEIIAPISAMLNTGQHENAFETVRKARFKIFSVENKPLNHTDAERLLLDKDFKPAKISAPSADVMSNSLLQKDELSCIKTDTTENPKEEVNEERMEINQQGLQDIVAKAVELTVKMDELYDKICGMDWRLKGDESSSVSRPRKRTASGSSKSPNGTKVYDCDQCPYTTMEQENFKRHMEAHIKTELKPASETVRRSLRKR